jgi:thioredoxin reductase (NADPH)
LIEGIVLNMKIDYDVIIVGAGAAGLSAAIYTCRAQLNTLVLEQLAPGGQINITAEVENYPGFPDGILGPELSQRMHSQAIRFGAKIITDEAVKLELEKPIKVVQGNDNSYSAKAIILTAGGAHNKLEVPGEDEFSGRGVSYCATCDANFFKGQDVIVIGGGDAAIDEGLYLTRIVNSVTVIHRRDQLRASPVLQQRAFDTSNMSFKWSHAVREIRGNGNVDRVLLENLKDGSLYEHSTNGAFIYVGYHPNSNFALEAVETDFGGHILTDIKMRTNIEGVFAAGDVRQHSFRQLGEAVGDGITAAMSTYEYLSEF